MDPPEKCDVLFLKSDNSTLPIAEGRMHYSPLLDSIGDLVKYRGLQSSSIVMPPSKIHRSKFYDNTATVNRRIFAIRLKDFLFRVMGRVTKKDDSSNREVGMWEDIFTSYSPRLIVAIQPGGAICRAARKLNIPIYDMQHGVISGAHPWYSKNYNFMRPIEELPDGYLCWDEASSESLKLWTHSKGLDVRVVGNPWFIRFIADSTGTPCALSAPSNKKPTILISLQWGNSHCFDERPFRKFLDSALEAAIVETWDAIDWSLRYHPVQIMGPERRHLKKYIDRTFGRASYKKWLESSLTPLPLVLSRADLHLTQNSTVAIEASWLGVRTGFIGGDVPEGYFHKEIEEGYASIIEGSPDVLLEWISETLSKGKAMPAMSRRNYDGFEALFADLGLNMSHKG